MYVRTGRDGGGARGVRAAAGRRAHLPRVQDHVLPVVRDVRLHAARRVPAPPRPPLRLPAAPPQAQVRAHTHILTTLSA